MADYLVIYEQGDTGSWGAYYPDLPGCVSVGSTREEVERLMREGVPFHLEGLREAGQPVPGPRSFAGTVVV